jgi:hypothetical protein
MRYRAIAKTIIIIKKYKIYSLACSDITMALVS